MADIEQESVVDESTGVANEAKSDKPPESKESEGDDKTSETEIEENKVDPQDEIITDTKPVGSVKVEHAEESHVNICETPNNEHKEAEIDRNIDNSDKTIPTQEESKKLDLEPKRASAEVVRDRSTTLNLDEIKIETPTEQASAKPDSIDTSTEVPDILLSTVAGELSVDKDPVSQQLIEKTTAESATPVTPDKDGSDLSLTEPSPMATDNGVPDKDFSHEVNSLHLPYPASLAKLRNLTVNIGPIRQMDLKSDMLHEILTLSDNFEIKFELKKDVGNRKGQEKSGFVRLPFEITTPGFLIRVARRLGDLHIDGRDMSVKFPETFNKALDECKMYVDEVKRLRNEKFEMKKRQISVKNVPANVTEDTIRSLFPEAQKITLKHEDLPDGGSRVGSVLLDFDTEEACIQCLDTNKDVFIEDCQLKMFRLYSDKKYRTMRPGPMYGRGRGLGRGRVMFQRGGFQLARIRKRVLGFGGTVRGKGMQGMVAKGNPMKKPIGSFMRNPAATNLQSTPKSSAPGYTQSSPRGSAVQGNGQRRRSSSTSKPGSYQSGMNYEGQFQDFTAPKREVSRGRGRSRPLRGRGSQSFSARNADRSPTSRGQFTRQSPHRSDRSPIRSGSSFRREPRQSPSTSRDDDPRAMMEYLKTTIARMEEKMTSPRDYGDRDYGRREDVSPSKSYRGHGRGVGRARGRGEMSRKRPADTRDYGYQVKRPFAADQDRRDSRSDIYGGHQEGFVSGTRRDSHGRGIRENIDYQIDRSPSSYTARFDTGSHSDNYRDSPSFRTTNYGNRDNRTRRDSYSGRSDNTKYSTGQFGGHSSGRGGRGQTRGRGYKGSPRGQLW